MLLKIQAFCHMCPGQNPFHLHVYWYDTSCFIGQSTSLGGQIVFIETNINICLILVKPC